MSARGRLAALEKRLAPRGPNVEALIASAAGGAAPRSSRRSLWSLIREACADDEVIEAARREAEAVVLEASMGAKQRLQALEKRIAAQPGASWGEVLRCARLGMPPPRGWEAPARPDPELAMRRAYVEASRAIDEGGDVAGTKARLQAIEKRVEEQIGKRVLYVLCKHGGELLDPADQARIEAAGPRARVYRMITPWCDCADCTARSPVPAYPAPSRELRPSESRATESPAPLPASRSSWPSLDDPPTATDAQHVETLDTPVLVRLLMPVAGGVVHEVAPMPASKAAALIRAGVAELVDGGTARSASALAQAMGGRRGEDA